MSLFKQIALIISTIFLLLYFIVLGVSFSVIKENAKRSLYENAQNSATSISLTIDNVGSDLGAIKTVLNASYDNGNYEKIIYIDQNNKLQYSRVKKYDDIGIPQWFLKIVRIEPVLANANVFSGWNNLGVLSIYGDLEVVYKQLYEIFLQLSIYLGLAYFGALIVLYFAFSALLRPLAKINSQAQAILNNKFIITQKLPRTLEFQSVTKSMNSMVAKVEQIFKTANEALTHNKELLYVDEVTKVYNRKYFSFKMSEYLASKSANATGILVLVNIQEAQLMNKLIGYQNTDKFFIDLAKLLQKSFSANPESFTARLNGTEFAAILPNTEHNDITESLKEFQTKLYELYDDLALNDTTIDINIGLCSYAQEKNIGELFAKIDYTLSNAKLTQCCEIVHIDKTKLKMGKEKWREILNNGIEKDDFAIEFGTIIEPKTNTAAYKTTVISLKTEDVEYAYAEFIAPLVELQMLNKFYFYIIEKILYSKTLQTEKISLQLPFGFVDDDTVLQKLDSVLDINKEKTIKNVVFEIPEEAFIKRYEHTLHLLAIFEKHQIHYSIYDFIANLNDYNFLKEFKPLYIVSDKTFILDNSQNINLVNIIMESIGVEMVISGELDENQMQQLKENYTVLIKKM